MVEDTVLDETSLRVDDQKEPEPMNTGKLNGGILVGKYFRYEEKNPGSDTNVISKIFPKDFFLAIG